MPGLPVAPFTGAWIEILERILPSVFAQSLPSRERGLKSDLDPVQQLAKRSLPSRERGLKYRAADVLVVVA